MWKYILAFEITYQFLLADKRRVVKVIATSQMKHNVYKYFILLNHLLTIQLV